MREVKQVIVMRKDLNMRKGKMVAQGAHASLAVLLNCYASGSKEYRIFIPKNDPAQQWLEESFVKICVGVPNEDVLIFVHDHAKFRKIPCALIKDAGRTEFKEPTYTCCAIGPWWSDEIDLITGDLKLL